MEIFWNTIAQYNEATWWTQLLITAAGILLTTQLYRKPTLWAKRSMKIYMVFLNGWISIVYYMMYCGARGHHYILAIFWGVIAVLWLWDLFTGYTPFERNPKYKVLVVEDDEDIRRYICRELASDYHTLESCNGKEALESIFNKTPDLVISDVMMPEMDGLTLCRKIKQNVNLNHIPVILLTAKTREEDNLEGLETGADAYMTKPFHIEILRKTTANLIRSRERLRNTYTGQQTQGDKVQPIEVQSPDDKLMERIIRVINENLSNPNLTVEMITTEVGISRVHLHRKLKELTNQTTRDFIRNIRLKQAAELLSKKRYTIAEVADLTGFTNPNNFSTAFKDLYGMPPSMYMEQHLKQDKNKEDQVQNRKHSYIYLFHEPFFSPFSRHNSLLHNA